MGFGGDERTGKSETEPAPKKSINTMLKQGPTGLGATPVAQTLRGGKAKASVRKKMAKSQRKERKATKTLAVVVGVFLLCWLPFFTLNIKNAICIKIGNVECQVSFLPFFLTSWLGYMNSFMNPIIYTIFNVDFRKAFRQLICPWVREQRALRSLVSGVTFMLTNRRASAFVDDLTTSIAV